MLKFSTTFLVFLFLFSCTPHKQSSVNVSKKDSAKKISFKNAADSSLTDIDYFKFDRDSVTIPSFEIEVNLSEKANEKLKMKKETIIVAAYFSGLPKDTTSKEYLESGEISIADAKRELTNSRVAKFDNVKFPKALYDSLADKDIELLINIYSGRRSVKDNLLDCDILEDKMSKVKDKRFTLKGKLIGEPGSF